MAENQCGADTVFFIVILTITLVVKQKSLSGISIYSNPAKDQVHISTLNDPILGLQLRTTQDIEIQTVIRI